MDYPSPGTPKQPLQVESPHEPFYQVPKAAKPSIPEGHVRLTKIRGCAIFQLYYPGDVTPWETIVHSRRFHEELVARGFDPARVEWIADYVWNFGEAIVRLLPDAPKLPKPVVY